MKAIFDATMVLLFIVILTTMCFAVCGETPKPEPVPPSFKADGQHRFKIAPPAKNYGEADCYAVRIDGMPCIACWAGSWQIQALTCDWSKRADSCSIR